MHEYLVKYLKKNNALDSEESARENIIFWMQFGCIYYVEKNNEVFTLFAMTIKHLSDDEDYRGIINQPCMYIFPYYNTTVSEHIVMDTIYEIPKMMSKENDLSILPINVIMIEEEKMKSLFSYVFKTNAVPDNVDGLVVFHLLIGEDQNTNNYTNIHKEYDELTDIEKKTYDFFNNFEDVSTNMINYFEKYQDRGKIGWMINCILSPEAIKNSKLNKYVKFNEN